MMEGGAVVDESTFWQHLCPDCKVTLELYQEMATLTEATFFSNDVCANVYICPQCGRFLFYDYSRERAAKIKAARAAEEAGVKPPSETPSDQRAALTVQLEKEAQPQKDSAPDIPADPWETKKKGGLFGLFGDKE